MRREEIEKGNIHAHMVRLKAQWPRNTRPWVRLKAQWPSCWGVRIRVNVFKELKPKH